MEQQRPLAVVTGASTGIGYELAMLCARNGFDLFIVADEPAIVEAGDRIGEQGGEVFTLEADLSTVHGCERLCEEVEALGRPVEALLANAGRGLGQGFMDQDFDDISRVIDTNITGTLYLVHRLGSAMTDRGEGRILLTGSIAGLMPGTYQAVYNGTKAFIDSFAVALHHELTDSGVTVTCLMPGPTETEFFERAGLEDTRVGQGSKDDPADVARTGFEAMMRGETAVIHGTRSKLQAAMTRVLPQDLLAERHRHMAEPGGAAEGATPELPSALPGQPDH
jgi:short-subunit dehydrogenase